MQSVRDSVHHLLEDQIQRVGLQAHYEVQKVEIIGRRNQTSFTFHGLRDQSVHNMKSLEGADILWVEEAQNVSKKSWCTVIPTAKESQGITGCEGRDKTALLARPIATSVRLSAPEVAGRG
jgi:phage terminase large subunit